MQIRRIGVGAATAALLCASCYKSPTWTEDGAAKFSRRSSETVGWGSQLIVESIDSPTELGAAVEQQPLCREISFGTAAQPETDIVHKDTGTWPTYLMLGGGIVGGTAFSGDGTDGALLAAGIGMFAIGVIPMLLPSQKRVNRTRSLGEVAAWSSDARPCGERSPAAGVAVAVDIANGDGSRAVRFTARTDERGRVVIPRSSIDLWSSTCGEPVSGSLAVTGGVDREQWERSRLASSKVGSGLILEKGPRAGDGAADTRWAPERKTLHVSARRASPLHQHRAGIAHPRFDGVLASCVALRRQRIQDALAQKRRIERENRLRRQRELEQAALRQWQADESLRAERFDAGDGYIYAWVATSGKMKEPNGNLVRYQDRGFIAPMAATRHPGLEWEAAKALREHLEARLTAHVGKREPGEKVDADVAIGSFHQVRERRRSAVERCQRDRDGCSVSDSRAHGFSLPRDRKTKRLIQRAVKKPPPSPATTRLAGLCKCSRPQTFCLSVGSKTIDGVTVYRPKSLDVIEREIASACRVGRGQDEAQALARVEGLWALWSAQWREAARAKIEKRQARLLERQRLEAESRQRAAQARAEREAARRAAEEARKRACKCGMKRVNGACPDGFDPSVPSECELDDRLGCACPR